MIVYKAVVTLKGLGSGLSRDPISGHGNGGIRSCNTSSQALTTAPSNAALGRPAPAAVIGVEDGGAEVPGTGTCEQCPGFARISDQTVDELAEEHGAFDSQRFGQFRRGLQLYPLELVVDPDDRGTHFRFAPLIRRVHRGLDRDTTALINS